MRGLRRLRARQDAGPERACTACGHALEGDVGVGIGDGDGDIAGARVHARPAHPATAGGDHIADEVDVAVGAIGDDDGGSNRGAVYVLFLNGIGTVKSTQKISSSAGNFTAALDDGDMAGILGGNVSRALGLSEA